MLFGGFVFSVPQTHTAVMMGGKKACLQNWWWFFFSLLFFNDWTKPNRVVGFLPAAPCPPQPKKRRTLYLAGKNLTRLATFFLSAQCFLLLGRKRNWASKEKKCCQWTKGFDDAKKKKKHQSNNKMNTVKRGKKKVIL